MVQYFLNPNQYPIEESDVVVVPIPFEGAISYMPGAAGGPEAILKASDQLELFDLEQKIDFENFRIHTSPLPPIMHSYDEVNLLLSLVIDRMEPSRQLYLGIGGDHTVTIPAVEALVKRTGEIGVVQIDAHADLRNSYQENLYSHACIMRRISETVGVQNILGIGIRAICKEEREFVEENNVAIVPGNRGLHEDLLPDINDKLANLPDRVFITVDLDGLDPTIMPHVGTPVPGGLSWKQATSIIARIFERKTVIGADIVEIASGPGTERSDFAAALLGQKIIGHHINKVQNI